MATQATEKHPLLSRQEYVALDPAALMQCLVEQLVREAGPDPARPLRQSGEPCEETLLELTLDGVRYTLTRSLAPPHGERVSLSPRELAIAQLIAKGLPNKCIGDILEISPWTVATYLRRIFSKLDVTSRAAMVARLSEEQLL